MATTTTPHKKYSMDDLRAIGRGCTGRLPPVSAVQAMFLYEMQRETESECLFNDVLFRLAREENDSKQQEQSIEGLDERLKHLEKRVRLIVKARTGEDVQANRGALNARLVFVENDVASIKTQVTEMRSKIEADTLNTATRLDVLGEQLELISGTLDLLLSERTALFDKLQDHTEQLEKQADLTRCLTLQRAAVIKHKDQAPCSKLVTRLPVTSIEGRSFDLLVPKGCPLPAMKVDRRPDSPKLINRPLSATTVGSQKGLLDSMHAVPG